MERQQQRRRCGCLKKKEKNSRGEYAGRRSRAGMKQGRCGVKQSQCIVRQDIFGAGSSGVSGGRDTGKDGAELPGYLRRQHCICLRHGAEAGKDGR